MADRIALAIEPDTDTANQIRRLLEPKGFRVESIPNGDDAMEWGRDNKPAVIILSVEPRKVGYAISNKLRRSPSLREVPLVLISSEETLATFEQHKKLKSRADEYLLKPLEESVFVSKVAGLVGLHHGGDDDVHELDADSDIVLSEDDEDVIVDAEDEERTSLMGGDDGIVKDDTSQEVHDTGQTPFEGEKFDPETQAAFAALEAGGGESASKNDDMVDLRNLWSDDDLPPNLGWEKGEGEANDDPDTYRTGETLGPEVIESAAAATAVPAPIGDEEVPPAPDEVEFGDVATDAAGAMVLAEGFVDERRVKEAEARNAELEARIHSLEGERQTLRKEIEEARERFTQSATFSKEREFLGLREIINKKEKDILDLRDALDAKDRQILDHKDKIRELDRARRDLEEASLGFERNLVAANERVAELGQDSQKSSEREKAFKARLDDAHEELRKAREEIDALKKRMAQDDARARGENERLRADAETRLAEAEEAHRAEVAKLNDEHGQSSASSEGAHQSELARIDGAHRAEVDGLQRRIAEEQATASERLSTELGKIRKEHEKAIAAAREEQAVQLASERQAYEALTEQKERDHRNEILAMRRRQEEELAGAEERRQRDIAEQEARRVAELEAAETRRRGELQGRDEEHHGRVTDIERRHLTEKTELTEKHRAEYDSALGRAARAEGELAARVQEIEQAYRRLSGMEADVDAARVELGNRDVKLAQQRDRIAELEAKVADYEDQIVRAYQRIRADDKTTEKTRRALAVALALIDERANAPAAPTPRQQVADESSELKT
ncbi:MAG TPA: response regulator [Polyangia bacterium]|jgi:CheY-like chemotaxis protein|nr:response regulator [Polyangia bacterium]